VAEDTLNAKEYDSSEEKFNQDFDVFMNGLDHPLDTDHIEINPESLDPVDDREFIDYINSRDNPNNFDDLDDWTDDIDLFMEGLCNPHKIDELWQQSKAKKMWENFQSSFQNHHAPEENILQPDAQSESPLTDETSQGWDDMALHAEMGLPPPEPTYHPLGLKNLATIF